MAVAVVLLVAGALILWVGAEAAVHGAERWAASAGIQAFVIGAILFGVDLEGLGAAVVAAGRGETEIAAGEVFGTVLFLFTAAFGVALLISRKPVPTPSPTMLAAPAIGVVAGALAISDRHVSRPEGVILIALYGAYVFLTFREGRGADEEKAVGPPERAHPAGSGGANPSGSEPVPTESPGSGDPKAAFRLSPALTTVVGLVVLYVGALLLVTGGIRVVDRTGLAAGFIGAAVIGSLASLDEVLLEVLPVRRGVPELATGNLLGTLAAFTTGVLGLAALVRPLDLDGAVTVTFLGVAVLYAVIATTFFVRKRAGWGLGVFVLASWAAWLAASSRI